MSKRLKKVLGILAVVFVIHAFAFYEGFQSHSDEPTTTIKGKCLQYSNAIVKRYKYKQAFDLYEKVLHFGRNNGLIAQNDDNVSSVRYVMRRYYHLSDDDIENIDFAAMQYDLSRDCFEEYWAAKTRYELDEWYAKSGMSLSGLPWFGYVNLKLVMLLKSLGYKFDS